jgi:hypothetical protein
MWDVPSAAVFCSESIECFPGKAYKFLSETFCYYSGDSSYYWYIRCVSFSNSCVFVSFLLPFADISLRWYCLLLLLLLLLPQQIKFLSTCGYQDRNYSVRPSAESPRHITCTLGLITLELLREWGLRYLQKFLAVCSDSSFLLWRWYLLFPKHAMARAVMNWYHIERLRVLSGMTSLSFIMGRVEIQQRFL